MMTTLPAAARAAAATPTKRIATYGVAHFVCIRLMNSGSCLLPAMEKARRDAPMMPAFAATTRTKAARTATQGERTDLTHPTLSGRFWTMP